MSNIALFWTALVYFLLFATGLWLGDYLRMKYGHPDGGTNVDWDWYAPGPYSDDSGPSLPIPVSSR